MSNQGIDLSVNKTNGSVTLEIPTDTELQLSAGILSLLGISKQRLTGKHHGKIYLAKPKGLYIYLNKINTTTNFVDGALSTLLTIIPVTDKPFGKNNPQFESPIFKKLENGCITELSLQITDETGTVLNNHGLPIIIELLIK